MDIFTVEIKTMLIHNCDAPQNNTALTVGPKLAICQKVISWLVLTTDTIIKKKPKQKKHQNKTQTKPPPPKK